MKRKQLAPATDEELLAQALFALVLLVEAGHDEDCRLTFSPIDECPTCAVRHANVGRTAIKALKRRVRPVKTPVR
jgi:hypothetical protein